MLQGKESNEIWPRGVPIQTPHYGKEGEILDERKDCLTSSIKHRRELPDGVCKYMMEHYALFW